MKASALWSSDGGVETVTRHNAHFTWKLAARRPTVGCLQATLLHGVLRLVMIQTRRLQSEFGESNNALN